MSRVSLAANRRTRDKRLISGTEGGGGGPSIPDLLASFVAWWDAPSYTSGPYLLNRGTVGTPLDLTIVGATFSGGAFTFNGTSNYMVVADNANLDFAAADSFTAGIVITAASPVVGGVYMQKGVLTGTTPWPGWAIQADGTTANKPLGWIRDGTSSYSIVNNTGTQPSGQKGMFTFQRRVADDVVQLWLNGTAGATVTDTTTATLNSSDAFTVGRATNAAQYQAFQLHAAFVHRGVLTSQQIADIATYYGAA